MSNEKTLECKLLDPKTKELLAEGLITINESKPAHETKSLHAYEGLINFPAVLPDLDSKAAILELSPKISGKVFLHFTHNPGTSSLAYTTQVFFEDAVWKTGSWFDKL